MGHGAIERVQAMDQGAIDGAMDGASGRSHWEIDYRKIIGIYWNFDGKFQKCLRS
jgi:hypothetical protein